MNDQFTRREVNRALLVGAWAFLAPSVISEASHTANTLFDFAIAGGWYHGLKHVAADLAAGEKLVLHVAPDNPHDAFAVKVHRRDDLVLGYIPRSANEPIARLLQRGARIDATVVERLHFRRAADIPDDFAFTGFSDGDPRVRLTLAG